MSEEIETIEPVGPKIHRDMIKLRKLVGSVRAEKKSGVMFPVKSAKDLVIKLRTAIDKLKMQVGVVKQEPMFFLLGEGWICITTVTVRFTSDDGSFVDYVGLGNGGDKQDKAAGKASTYGYKDALTKALTAPDAEMVDADDETPFEEPEQPIKRGPGRPKKDVVKDALDNMVSAILPTEAEVTKQTVEFFIDQLSKAPNTKVLGVLGAKITKIEWTPEEETVLGEAYRAAVERIG